VHSVVPEFTDEARRAKYWGVVLVSIIVDAQGMPRDLHVVHPIGMGLDQKAIEAVKKFRFKPAMKDGKPVPVKVTIEVNFRLYTR
jgi:TonB family protein